MGRSNPRGGESGRNCRTRSDRHRRIFEPSRRYGPGPLRDGWLYTARGHRPYPPTLRCVLLGGGPAPRNLLERCARLGVPVVQTYGLTETASQVVTLAPEDALRKLG
ncbi:AMP-binding protein, partial [Streptococcus pneumoniae]